jgi:hypothetical protein
MRCSILVLLMVSSCLSVSAHGQNSGSGGSSSDGGWIRAWPISLRYPLDFPVPVNGVTNGVSYGGSLDTEFVATYENKGSKIEYKWIEKSELTITGSTSFTREYSRKAYTKVPNGPLLMTSISGFLSNRESGIWTVNRTRRVFDAVLTWEYYSRFENNVGGFPEAVLVTPFKAASIETEDSDSSFKKAIKSTIYLTPSDAYPTLNEQVEDFEINLKENRWTKWDLVRSITGKPKKIETNIYPSSGNNGGSLSFQEFPVTSAIAGASHYIDIGRLNPSIPYRNIYTYSQYPEFVTWSPNPFP